MVSEIDVWGDSILKGVVYDEQKQRYLPLRGSGCMELIAQKMGITIKNHAHFGMTSEKGKLVVERGLQAITHTDASLIGFGGNDIDYDWKAIAETPEQEHLPNTPPEQFKKNVEEIVLAHDKAGIRPVLMTLPPIDAQRYFDWVSRNLNGENILKWLGKVEVIYQSHFNYDQIIRQVAQRMGVALIDVRAAFTALNDTLPFLCLDGIHPNEQGHLLMEGAFEQALPLLG